MELPPQLLDASLREKIEEKIAELRQEQYGRNDSIDNNEAISLLHHLGVILKEPENWHNYIRHHNPPLNDERLSTVVGLTEILQEHDLITQKQQAKITGKIAIRLTL